MANTIIILVTVFCFMQAAFTYVPVQSKMKSFSSAIKGGRIGANTEKVLYEHNTGQPGVITEQWFTGRGVMDERMRICIYIDGETTASIDFMLFLGHGIGSSEADEVQYIPWGTRKVAHTADGGIYNTYRIPFGKSVKITGTHPVGGAFWYIVRGVENYPLVLGDIMLPSTTRLKLYKNEGVQLQPLQFITLANITNSAGALFQVTLAANSTDFNYLEACYRANIDDEKIQFLSSGTEDFFLSAYYFNKGIYHLDNSGLTSKIGKGIMSAYKFFENDPLLFAKSFSLVWRCGEKINGADGCPNDFPPPSGNTADEVYRPLLANTIVTTYAWVYEYSL